MLCNWSCCSPLLPPEMKRSLFPHTSENLRLTELCLDLLRLNNITQKTHFEPMSLSGEKNKLMKKIEQWLHL